MLGNDGRMAARAGLTAEQQKRAIQRDRKRVNARTRRHKQLAGLCSHGRGCFDRAKVVMEQVCVECGSTERVEADHKVPLAQGGWDCRENAQMWCRHCNRTKGDR